TLMLYDTPGGLLMGQSGGPRVRVTNSTSINVLGQSFKPGTVTLSVDSAGGPKVATANADVNGKFTVLIGTDMFSVGNHQLVATEGAVSANVLLIVQESPR